MPKPIIVDTMAVPPQLTMGSGTPTTGNSPETMARFTVSPKKKDATKAPVDEPEIAVVVLTENSGGGSTAYPIARDMLDYWMSRDE